MRRLALILLLLLIIPNVAFAKIYHNTDNFDGHSWYYTTNNQQSPMFSLAPYFNLDTTFNLVQHANDEYTRNMILDYNSDGAYYIEPTIKIRIDDAIFTLTTSGTSSRSNGSVSNVWSVDGDFYAALMNTKNDVVMRFNYHDTTGQYTKEYKLKYKYIKEVQDMYTSYGNKAKPLN